MSTGACGGNGRPDPAEAAPLKASAAAVPQTQDEPARPSAPEPAAAGSPASQEVRRWRIRRWLGCDGHPSAREELNVYAGVAPEVAADQPALETFEELAPIFLRRKISDREKALEWARYRHRWVRWSGTLVSFTSNGATFKVTPVSTVFDVSVQFEATARQRLHGYRVGDTVQYVGRLDSYDDVWRTFYLVHGDLPAALPRPDAGAEPRPAH